MIKFRLFGFGKPEQPETQSEGAPPASPGPQMDTAPTVVNPNGKRVLIVDDDKFFVRATALKLQAAGFQVATARDGSEAITSLAETSADAILMDINFPADVGNGGMGSWDGFQIISWLRGLPASKGARFMIVSSTDTEASRKRAQQLGVAGYFPKPLDFDSLIATVSASN